MAGEPNFVIVMSDQHNPHVMRCGGDPYVRTPHIDALAARGAQFVNMYCPYPLCVPSRMAFMTARMPSDLQVYDNDGVLASPVPTLAHSLGAAGYETVLCGRMHFVGADQLHGFERRLVGDCQDGSVLSKAILGEGYNRTNGQTRYAVQYSGYGKAGYEAYDAMVTERACSFLASRGEGERPLALVAGLMLPHNPLICAKDLFDHYMETIPEPKPFEEPANLHPAIRKWRERRGCPDLTTEQIHRGIAAYYGLVETLDHNIGRIVDAVDGSALAKNTIIIYLSDHGDLAGEHGMFWKSSFYDGSARVPFILSLPGRYPTGTVIDCVASLIDVGPTLLDIAGAPAIPGADGRSFRAFLEDGDTSNWPNEAFGEYLGFWGDAPTAMLRTGPWKLVYFDETKSCQLFNLEEDPGEIVDRAKDPACQTLIEEGRCKIHKRWSAEAMRRGAALTRRTTATPSHPSPPLSVGQSIGDGEQHNVFDTSQLDGVFPDRPMFE